MGEDILSKYIQETTKQMNENIEKTVVDYLKKQGYEMKDTSYQSVAALQEQLTEEGKRLRIEIFTKMSGKLTTSMVVIPFFESLDQEISRVEIYRMLNLAEQGYQI